MYKVTISESMSSYFANHVEGISFEVADPFNMKEYVQDFAQKGFEVLVSYQPDEERGE